MRHVKEPKSHLTSLLWMTPLDALSPFYRVPLPSQDQMQEMKEEQPGPIQLRFLTLNAFVVNWIAWLSRVETYASLGVSRFPPNLISASVAASLLHPFSMGCGQTPFIDIWPLWILRQILTFSLHLPQHLSRNPGNKSSYLSVLFPFSDLDEI